MPADGGACEIRVRGPMVTPGYFGRPDLTAAAFDADGFYRTGNAVALADPADPSAGLVFRGRIAEDFKLASGTFVRVGAVRTRLLSAIPVLSDAVLAGEKGLRIRARLAERGRGQAGRALLPLMTVGALWWRARPAWTPGRSRTRATLTSAGCSPAGQTWWTCCMPTPYPRASSSRKGPPSADTAAWHCRRAGAHQPADRGRAVGDRADRRSGAVRARQRVVVAVLAADHARAAGRLPAAGGGPARLRRDRPGTGGRDPRARRLRRRPGRGHRGAGTAFGPPGGLEHGRRGGAAVPRRTARGSPRRVRDPGGARLSLRIRRYPRDGGHAVRSVRSGFWRRFRQS